MTIHRPDQQPTTGIPHSGNAPEGIQELPVDLFDKSLADAVSEGLVTTPDTSEQLTEPERSAAPTTTEKTKWHQRTTVRIAGAVIAASAIAIPVGIAVTSATHSEVGAPNPGQPLPEVGSPDYDPFQKIGNNSEISIGDVDRLLTYFNSGEMDRNSLVVALAQATQQEVDRIFEVIASPDGADNGEITTILNSYGLETNEIPYDTMGRISEINSLVVQDVDIIASEGYPDIPYEDIKQALAQFTPEEAAIALGVINGTASYVDLNNALRDNGVTLGDGYLS